MADKLTPQQEMAVKNRGGKLLVSAAAGSGKTKVLVDRLLSYLTDPVDPANLDEFLIITYTKAAAGELRGKITDKLTKRIAEEPENLHLQKQMQRLFLTKISTVHGFCGDILREYSYKLDIPADFRVADENECLELRDLVLDQLLDEVYESSEDDETFHAFVDTQGLGRDDRLVPQLITQVYDSARCHLDPEGWLNECLENMDIRQITDASQTVWGAYLIQDLMEYLDLQISVFEKCILMLEPEGAKAADNLSSTLLQLKALRSCRTWDEILDAKEISYGTLRFPPKYPDQDGAERIKAARDGCKKGLTKKLKSFADPSARVLGDLDQTALSAQGLVKLVREFSQRYASIKRSRRVLDFSDLEHKTLDLLLGKKRTGPTAAAAEIGERFREIMVDEYQDSNAVQDAIFDALTRKRKNCFMVGDVKQSIYQFRLADPRIFLKKYGEYEYAEIAAPGQGRKVLLSHNFRSGGEVVEAVNAVFTQCMSPAVGDLAYTEAEQLREGVPHEPLEGAIELYALHVQEESYAEEAAFVAQRIQEMLKEGTMIRGSEGMRPVASEDIVILLRSPGSMGSEFRRALEARGIRCNTGGTKNLMETEEIGTLRSILQIIVNPKQDIPLVSALASPAFGFTADDLASLRSQHRAGCIYDALVRWDHWKGREFLEKLEILRKDAGRKPLAQLLEKVFSLTRMDSIYGAMEDGPERMTNLQTFYMLASDYGMGGARDLGQFLEYLDTLQDKGLQAASNGAADAVTIMSIHKSKGLEFPVVFLCGLAKRFNQENLRANILCHQELGLGLSVADFRTRTRYPSLAKRAIMVKMAAEGVSEEMRVLYVAMTRARDRLIMTYTPRSLENSLKSIALRKGFDGGDLLCREADCFGDWVMLAAMSRLEAGALFAIGGNPGDAKSSGNRWRITVDKASAAEASVGIHQEEKEVPGEAFRQMKTALAYRYGHTPATKAPSKQTATGRKGREKDEEAAQDTQQAHIPRKLWRKPTFRKSAQRAIQAGTATHSAMQYLRYDCCGSLEEIQGELERMAASGLLSPEEKEMVDCGKILAFFRSEIGEKLCSGVPHLREFKFSILDDGRHYGPGLEGEQVLLQGVVDCALLEEDGITVLDFKTDKVTDQTLEDAVERYRLQVQTYSAALSRIYEMPVKKEYLYFFHLDCFVEV